MTNKELRKLKRTELIELMLMQSRELDEQRARRQELEEALESRRLKVTEAGSIAAAAMEINHVFAAAQSAANQYLDNIKALQADAEKQIEIAWKQLEDCLTDLETEYPELLEPLRECRRRLAEAKGGEGAEADETEETT